MVRVRRKLSGFVLPYLADGLIGCEAFERREATTEIASGDKVCEVLLKLVVGIIMVALDGCFLDRPVHPLYLSIDPRVFHLSQSMLDAVLVTYAVKNMVKGVFVVGVVDAVHGHLCVVTRLRLDARLFVPPASRRARARGRPRRTGQRLPALARRLADPTTPWSTRAFTDWYGHGERHFEIGTACAVLSHPGWPIVPLALAYPA